MAEALGDDALDRLYALVDSGAPGARELLDDIGLRQYDEALEDPACGLSLTDPVD